MGRRFEELAWRQTPLGAISLRRRWDPTFDTEVFEVKLDEEYLMSSLFTLAEQELARFGLELLAGDELDVVVGGLGLGYTARAVLADQRVRSLVVVDVMPDVIDWHRRGLLPHACELTDDPRCRLVEGDFFAMAVDPDGFDARQPGRRFDAVLLDIDHSPRHLLHPSNGGFYTPDGLRCMAQRLRDRGVFALWSNDPPEQEFVAVLRTVFGTAETRIVTFDNPLQGRTATNTIYLAQLP